MKRSIAWLLAAALAVLCLVPFVLRAAGTQGESRSAAADTSRVHLGAADSGTDAFVAWPAGKGAAPGIVVMHEWWGLNGQIRTIAKRLAQAGYVAIVPDLYHGKVADDDNPKLAHELSRGLAENAARGHSDGAIAYLKSQPRLAKSKIGTLGFCMGGRLSELEALHSPDVAACVMFYGLPESDPAKLAALRGPLQGHFGATDQGIGPDKAEALRQGLAQAGKAGEVFEYEGAGHAFMHDGRPSYHADAARQAWSRTLAFFQKHLRG